VFLLVAIPVSLEDILKIFAVKGIGISGNLYKSVLVKNFETF
jgi:hypothetical protein